jgi:arylsulfatase A-like enzyme
MRLLCMGVLISVLLCAAEAGETPKSRPNIVFLLADDMRWDAMGCAGNKIIQTPNIDSLAARGVMFKNHFVTTSICCVSRASIFSGQYERRHGINDFHTDFTPAALAQTYPMLLKAAGYRVGFIGKYGVGDKLPKDAFDYWKGFPGQGRFFEKGDPVHLTSKMGDQAIEFLKGGDGTKPFCLAISFKAPHAQDGAPREFPPDARDENYLYY